ncbi:TPA: acyltransferase [Serratia marcescens]
MAKNQNINILKIIATFLVILLHTSSASFSSFHDSWIYADLYNSISRISVPVFFMISGYFLLNNPNNEGFYSKRISKILIPLIAWSALYYIYKNGFTISFEKTVSLMWAPSYYHLWFMYCITAFYVVTPLIKRAFLEKDKKSILVFLSVWFAFISLLSTTIDIQRFIISPRSSDVIRPSDAIIYVSNVFTYVSMSGFFILGGLFKFYSPMKSKFALLAIFSICTALTFYLTYLSSIYIGKPTQYLFKYFSPLVVLASTAFFLYFINKKTNSKKNESAINVISDLCFGVYLVHVIVLECMARVFSINFGNGMGPFTIPITAVACFTISMVMVYVLKKTPFINRAV